MDDGLTDDQWMVDDGLMDNGWTDDEWMDR